MHRLNKHRQQNTIHNLSLYLFHIFHQCSRNNLIHKLNKSFYFCNKHILLIYQQLQLIYIYYFRDISMQHRQYMCFYLYTFYIQQYHQELTNIQFHLLKEKYHLCKNCIYRHQYKKLNNWLLKQFFLCK